MPGLPRGGVYVAYAHDAHFGPLHVPGMNPDLHPRGPGRPPGRSARPTRAGDRRRARRYRLDLPVEFNNGHGLTRDVSESGVLFDTQVTLNVGDHVEFSLVLGRYDPQGPYRVKCAGEVIRIEPDESGRSVAIHLNAYDVNG